MGQGIAGFFNDLQKSWKENSIHRKCHRAAMKAIDGSDAQSLQQILDKVQNRETFLKKYQDDLMKRAIYRGGSDVFDSLLEFSKDPNACVSEIRPTPGGDSWHTYRMPLLYYPLSNRSHDIALKLAGDPRTNIELKASDGQIPMSLAEACGMKDVVAVLMNRTAELREKEAENLRKSYLGP